MSEGERAQAGLPYSEEDLVTRVAWLYYKEKLTQADIALRTLLSRQKVQRCLEKARDLEIIRIEVKHPRVNLLGVEERLREAYGLKDAVVLPLAGADPAGLLTSFAMAGASYLERLLEAAGDCSLGLGWGNTTARLADYFERPARAGRVSVVSLIGNLMVNVSMNPFILGQSLAAKLDCPFYTIWAPAIAQTKERAEVFRSEPWIHEVLGLAARADVRLVSIGELSTQASLFRMGYLSGADLERLSGKGAVGDILCRFLDARGEVVEDEIHDRVVGVPLDSLREPGKTTVGVAGGPSKLEPILAALRQKYVNVLITDESTATALLDRA